MMRSSWHSILFQLTVGSSLGVVLLGLLFGAPSVMLDTATLCAVVGAFLGATTFVLYFSIGLISAPWRTVVWIGLGLGTGIAVSHGLGAFERLSGPYAKLGFGTIGLGVVGGALGGLSLALFDPNRSGRFALFIPDAFGKKLLSAGFVTLAGTLVVTDSTTAWLKTYPLARWTLTLAAWQCASLAVVPLLSLLNLTRRSRTLVSLIWTAAVMLGVVRLREPSSERLQLLSSTDHSVHLLAFVHWLTDWDRDGSSHVLGGGDCAPFNPRIHPRAREVPGNGVDDNCMYGDALPAPAVVDEYARHRNEKSPPSVLFITVDTLRADHTTPYGYERNTTPHLQHFATTARRFANTLSPGAWTCLALPSLFSGMYARRFEWEAFAALKKRAETEREGGLIPMPWEEHIQPGEEVATVFTLPAKKPWWNMVRALKERGLVTVAVLSTGVQSIVRHLDLGFEDVHTGYTSDRDITDQAVRLIAAFGERPFFLWVHYFNPHLPRETHPRAPNYGDSVVDLYDHEVFSTDLEIGRLLDALEEVAQETAVVITADHGEVLVSPITYHGSDLYQDTLRVPLLLRAPGVEPGVTLTPASLVDLAPTILAVTDTPIPTGLDGVDLRTLEGQRTVLSDVWRVNRSGEVYLDLTSATTTEQHIIWDRMLNQRTLIRSNDYERPPAQLALTEAQPLMADALGAYVERAIGGPR